MAVPEQRDSNRPKATAEVASPPPRHHSDHGNANQSPIEAALEHARAVQAAYLEHQRVAMDAFLDLTAARNLASAESQRTVETAYRGMIDAWEKVSAGHEGREKFEEAMRAYNSAQTDYLAGRHSAEAIQKAQARYDECIEKASADLQEKLSAAYFARTAAHQAAWLASADPKQLGSKFSAAHAGYVRDVIEAWQSHQESARLARSQLGQKLADARSGDSAERARERYREASLNYEAASEAAAKEARERLLESYRKYLRAIREAWIAADADTLDSVLLANIAASLAYVAASAAA